MEKWKKVQENLKNIENLLPEVVVDFSLEQIQNLQNQIKKIEDKIKEVGKNKKVKTITVSEDAHMKIKKYCVENNLKMNEWVEQTLLDNMK